MTTLGLVGAGRIGSQLARLGIAHGYDVVVSNSRAPESLAPLVGELGPHARAGTVAEAAQAGDIVVVAIPLRSIAALPPSAFAGKVVIDTGNYYPARDGVIPELEDGRETVSGLLQQILPQAHIVKAFNHIPAANLTADAAPPGTPGRRALAIAGDDDDAKALISELLDEFGFDVVDLGPLAEGWRFERDMPAYGQHLTASGLRSAAAAATRKERG